MPQIGDDDHTLLSPSRYPRIELCVGSVAMEEYFPRGTNSYAELGTAKHMLFQMVFNNDQIVKGEVVKEAHTHDFLGKTIVTSAGSKYVVDFELAEPVQKFIDRVRAQLEPGDILLIEQRVDYSDDIGIPGQSGTADVQIVKIAQKQLRVIDAKFGVKPVYAQGNGQCRLYGVGSLNQLELAYEIETVRNEIIQPALDWGDGTADDNIEELTVAELRAWVKDVAKPLLHRAYNIYLLAHAEGTDYQVPLELLNPSEKACFFCRAKGACPARTQEALNDVADGFVDLDAPSISKQLTTAVGDLSLLSNDELAKRLRAVPFVQDWCKSVLALGDVRLLAGQEVDGFKVVMGKKGDRKWRDDPAELRKVEAYLRRKLGKDAIVTSIITPPAAEGKLKKQDPKSWAFLEKTYVTQADGKPSVAPADDKRPAISVGAKAEDFPALAAPEDEDLSDLA